MNRQTLEEWIEFCAKYDWQYLERYEYPKNHWYFPRRKWDEIAPELFKRLDAVNQVQVVDSKLP